MIGRIVISKAGRDKGKFMVVLGQSERGYLLSEGKERPISRPKLKNEKHISFTNCVLEEKQFKTNKSLRRALAEYKAKSGELQEED